ncbi:MAG: glutathione S-transferase [Rhodobacter sp.]|nr:glutathione S-transferase [Rhodobacter sp.]
MQLYDNPASPYCRKVKALLHETGQTGDVEIVFAAGHPLAPEKMPTATNPLGKIPALVRPDGPALYDSRVICRFLDARAQAGLYPDSRIWEVLTLEATADGIMDAALLMVYETRARPEDKQFPEMVDAQWEKIARALDAIGQRWMGHLAGPVDMGHFAIGCALGYLDLRQDARNWRQGRDALADWYAGFSGRPSMEATVPIG